MNKLIFLVEDDSAIADVYRLLMEKSKFDVNVLSSGQEAVKAINKIGTLKEYVKPDIILLDLILPDMNGVDVLREIKNNNKTKDIKVFILTNQEDVKFDNSEKIKPDKVIIKANVTPTQLIETIKKEIE